MAGKGGADKRDADKRNADKRDADTGKAAGGKGKAKGTGKDTGKGAASGGAGAGLIGGEMPLYGMSQIHTTAEAHEASAIPCAHVVHTREGAPQTPESLPLPAAMTREPVEDKSPAKWAYERLVLYIQNFEQQLDTDQEVALGLTGAEAGVLRIEGLGYFSPDMLTFYGRDEDGARTQLIQHVSQLNVMLVALPKDAENEEPQRIGFRLVAGLETPKGA